MIFGAQNRELPPFSSLPKYEIISNEEYNDLKSFAYNRDRRSRGPQALDLDGHYQKALVSAEATLKTYQKALPLLQYLQNEGNLSESEDAVSHRQRLLQTVPVETITQISETIRQLQKTLTEMNGMKEAEIARNQRRSSSSVSTDSIRGFNSIIYANGNESPSNEISTGSDDSFNTKICEHCQSSETPEWRKGPTGPRTLCNACGLFYGKLIKKFGRQSADTVMADRKRTTRGLDRKVPAKV